MILERLEITGFGCLRDLSINLHPRVTIITGTNESGKSTLLRALRAALYGIDAGGQGRPVDRSDWSRHEPWSPGGYGLALTYRLDDSRRIRVARRFDTREQTVQVLELGGADLTDELRSGRAVTPGRFHLGIDEAVFCATAWLSDDGLRLDAPESAARRPAQLQEAIERLADTRRGVTAAQAQARLRDAMDRVGSERRTTSPLGVATSRLRSLESALEEVRGRLAGIEIDRERLATLDAAAAVEVDRWHVAERARLGARLVDARERRTRLAGIVAEAEGHAATIARTAEHASFPIDDDAPAAALGGELTQARSSSADARRRWEATEQRVRPIRERRARIAAGVAAIGPVPDSDAAIGERAQRLRGALSVATAEAARDAGGESRAAALRREIAATGLRRLPAGVVDDLLPLLDASRRGGAGLGLAAAALAGLGVLVAALLSRAHLGPLAAVILALALAGGALLGVDALRRERRARAARTASAGLAGGAGVDLADLKRLSGRLSALRALHVALDDESRQAGGRQVASEALHSALLGLTARCAELALEAGLPPAESPSGAAPTAMVQAAEETLRRVDVVVAAARRRRELVAEDALLAADDEAASALREHLDRARDTEARLEGRLRRLLDVAGVRPDGDPVEAIAGLGAACEARRLHDTARRRLNELQQSARSVGGDDAALEQLATVLVGQLRQVGGDPDTPCGGDPPDSAELQRFDLEAEQARRSASSATEMARDLRARLSGVVDTLPSIADLEDDRDACRVARDRSAAQLRALRIAAESIENASRATHRELAPRLAASLGSRLAGLTEARYVEANVDTEHFAVSLLCRERPDMVPLDALSHGTRDQVALLLRLALCEVLGDAGERSPLLLDEPLITSDPGRRGLFLDFLRDLSTAHQVVLCTADPGLVAALQLAAAGDCGCVELRGPAGERAGDGVSAADRRTTRIRVV